MRNASTAETIDRILSVAKRKALAELAGRTKRNDPCPCGSGWKFKRCCLKESKR